MFAFANPCRGRGQRRIDDDPTVGLLRVDPLLHPRPEEDGEGRRSPFEIDLLLRVGIEPIDAIDHDHHQRPGRNLHLIERRTLLLVSREVGVGARERIVVLRSDLARNGIVVGGDVPRRGVGGEGIGFQIRNLLRGTALLALDSGIDEAVEVGGRRIEFVVIAPTAVLVGKALLPRLERQRHVQGREVFGQFLLGVGVDPMLRIDGQNHLRSVRHRHPDPSGSPFALVGPGRDEGRKPFRRVAFQAGDALQRIRVGRDGIKSRVGVESVGFHPVERQVRIARQVLHEGLDHVIRRG